MYQIVWTEYSKKDYEELDRSQKVLIDKSLNRIRQRGMQAEKTLKGPLKGCNKLKHQKAGLRVIFTEIDGQVQIIQIIAIVKRGDDKVYRYAKNRINKE